MSSILASDCLVPHLKTHSFVCGFGRKADIIGYDSHPENPFNKLLSRCNSQIKYHFPLHASRLAPPVSMASISACVNGVRWNRWGRSFRSQNWLAAGLTAPSDRPDCAPMESGCGACWVFCVEAEGVGVCCCWGWLFSGPCCVAFSRYAAKDSGRVADGDSG
jgi:hypothetical protein